RLLSPWKIFFKVLKIRPDTLIITTHELLLVSVLLKLFTSCRVLYDVQENYFRNIFYTNTFPPVIRHLLALWVRVKEIIFSPFVNHFILAERGYTKELPFAKPFIVVQNKLKKSIADVYRKKENNGYNNLIFSGTLAETTGVYNTIELAKNLHALDHSFSLTIIGYCSKKFDHKKLSEIPEKSPFIRYLGQTQPLPHSEILKEIQRADFGIIYYPANPSTTASIPTKLFEYLALGLPVLIRHTPESHQMVSACNGGVVLHEPINFPELVTKMKDFSPGKPDEDVYLESEIASLIQVLNK
ncbi:MAG: glycosyltransferase, partial [Cyclobacteriaceae bacterium]|nr:glycosyltransferase [Cyclobacteriaceae bacterium]